MAQQILTHCVDESDSGDRLDRYLASVFTALSRTRLKALIENGAVCANGRTIKEPSYRVKHSETLTVTVPDATPAKPAAQAIALEIRYEDDDLLVVDKPAGMVVHPAPGNPDRTLVNALLAHCGQSLSGIGGVRRPGIVHRIDKDTSGLLVVAKNDAAHAGLAAQFAAHTIERAYLAVVWGRPNPPRGSIEGDIGRNPRNRKTMAVVPRGKPARTHYAVQRNLGLGASIVECRLETGRTHQIRVHCAHIGHSVIGDPLYGGRNPGRRATMPPSALAIVRSFPRQALHAYVIGFDHPLRDERIHLTSEIPRDIKDLIESLTAKDKS
jgi:23S rRNA pseudouridine1911/1915/1917 synthase